jgi:hypothetical protein
MGIVESDAWIITQRGKIECIHLYIVEWDLREMRLFDLVNVQDRFICESIFQVNCARHPFQHSVLNLLSNIHKDCHS